VWRGGGGIRFTRFYLEHIGHNFGEVLGAPSLDFGKKPVQVHAPVMQLEVGNDAGIQRLNQGGL
jgi:hypothetical protein